MQREVMMETYKKRGVGLGTGNMGLSRGDRRERVKENVASLWKCGSRGGVSGGGRQCLRTGNLAPFLWGGFLDVRGRRTQEKVTDPECLRFATQVKLFLV